MRNRTLGSGVALAVLTALGACGQTDEPAANEQKSTSPSASTTPDDVSVKLPPTEQEVVTYSDRDALTHGVDITVGRNYVLYARCRGQMLSVEIAGNRAPWYPACDGATNRMPMADGPGVISVQLAWAAKTRWTFAVANVKPGAK